MRIVIIGGTHFIGPHLVRGLHRLGHQLTVYHRGQHRADLPAEVRHVESPHAGIPVLQFPDALLDPAPDVVVHMFPVGQADAEALVRRFAGVARRVVGISSGDVYRAYGRLAGIEPGPLEPVPLSEDAPLRSVLYPHRSPKGPADDWTHQYEKLLAERELLSDGPLPGTILRLPAVYGPGDPYRRLRPYIKRMADGRPRILLDRALAPWRWTHGYVENVAHAIALAVSSEQAAGRVYNVGEAATPTLAERVRLLAEVTGWEGELAMVPTEQMPIHLATPFAVAQDLVMETSRLRTELSFAEPVSVEQGLARTVAWERAQPPGLGDPTTEDYAAEDTA
jgi:nucleoside-diphosphate-sugar epimerase